MRYYLSLSLFSHKSSKSLLVSRIWAHEQPRESRSQNHTSRLGKPQISIWKAELKNQSKT